MTAPLRRSPAVEDLFKVELMRPATPAPTEDIPYPYCYTMHMVPEDERHALKEKFTHDANMRRWHHVYKSEIKKK